MVTVAVNVLQQHAEIFWYHNNKFADDESVQIDYVTLMETADLFLVHVAQTRKRKTYKRWLLIKSKKQ